MHSENEIWGSRTRSCLLVIRIQISHRTCLTSNSLLYMLPSNACYYWQFARILLKQNYRNFLLWLIDPVSRMPFDPILKQNHVSRGFVTAASVRAPSQAITACWLTQLLQLLMPNGPSWSVPSDNVETCYFFCISLSSYHWVFSE